MSDPVREDLLVDWLLGEVTGDQSEELQRAAARDAAVAQSAAELRCLFDDLRSLTVEPDQISPRAGLAVRRNLERRLELRRPAPTFDPQQTVVTSLKVAAVAAVTLGALMIGERWWADSVGGADSAVTVAEYVPVVVPGHSDEAIAAAGAVTLADGNPTDGNPTDGNPTDGNPTDTEEVSQARHAIAWLTATNNLASLRREFKSRFNPGLRRRAIRAAGWSASLEIRIEHLAGQIARKIDDSLTAGEASVQDVSMSLRALLAAGSTKRMGADQATVVRCSDYLERRIKDLQGGELATGLAGLIDIATVYGGSLARLVESQATRMTQGIIEPAFTGEDRELPQLLRRPELLSWNTPVAQLADAGRVLRVAPYFGVDGAAAARARSYISEHLGARIAQTKDERPDLLAAHLYGFGELVDRSAIELKLRLWRARDLIPEHFVALHHVSWSRFPLRTGWADFQRDLRRVLASETPESATDASALLLSLAVNYAAPGCQELLDWVALR